MKKYHQSTLNRFIERIGSEAMKPIHVQLVKICIRKGIIKAKKLIIDGFLIFSYLNTLKYLRNKKIDLEEEKKFFKELLSKIEDISFVDILLELGRNAIPHIDKIKVYIFQVLWNMPSKKGCVETIKKTEGLEEAFDFKKRCAGVGIYSSYIKDLESMENFNELQRRILWWLSSVSLIRSRFQIFQI